MFSRPDKRKATPITCSWVSSLKLVGILVPALGFLACSTADPGIGFDAGLPVVGDGIDAGEDASTEVDSGLWAWKDLSFEAECDGGCIRLTDCEEVGEREWDVWEGLLVYRDEEFHINVVDVEAMTTVELPALNPLYPIGYGVHAFSPTIYQKTVFYLLSMYETDPPTRMLVRADLETRQQEVIWQKEGPFSLQDKMPTDLDVWGGRLVAAGGAGDSNNYALTSYDAPWPTIPNVLIDESYGGLNSIWDNWVVFWDSRNEAGNITAYDFDVEEFLPVTLDEEYQYAPRIHDGRVVYMDFRLGDSSTFDGWANAMVVMYDIKSGKKLRITNGNWIAAYPDIYGDRVVWMDYRACPSQKKNKLECVEIWGLDTGTTQRVQLTNLPGRAKTAPRIFGDRLYVKLLDNDLDGDAIYLFGFQD
jgi:beta propeller repeat protein